MNKVGKDPGTVLAPVPVVMVSCAAPGYKPNILTIAWAGTVCSAPPMLGISIRPERYSYDIIEKSGEFVVNLPDIKLLKALDFCGVVSGRDLDKFEATGLTPVPAKVVRAPLIREAPVNIECRVKNIMTLGVHDLFLAEIVHVWTNENVLSEKGILDLEKMHALAYGNGSYYEVGKPVGTYGFSRHTL